MKYLWLLQENNEENDVSMTFIFNYDYSLYNGYKLINIYNKRIMIAYFIGTHGRNRSRRNLK